MTSTTLQIPFIYGALATLCPAGKGANLSMLLFHKVLAVPDALVPTICACQTLSTIMAVTKQVLKKAPSKIKVEL